MLSLLFVDTDEKARPPNGGRACSFGLAQLLQQVHLSQQGFSAVPPQQPSLQCSQSHLHLAMFFLRLDF